MCGCECVDVSGWVCVCGCEWVGVRVCYECAHVSEDETKREKRDLSDVSPGSTSPLLPLHNLCLLFCSSLFVQISIMKAVR